MVIVVVYKEFYGGFMWIFMVNLWSFFFYNLHRYTRNFGLALIYVRSKINFLIKSNKHVRFFFIGKKALNINLVEHLSKYHHF